MRFEIEFAEEEYKKIEVYLKKRGYTCSPSGSLRRKKEDVGDIDIVVKGEKEEVLNYVSNYERVEKRTGEYNFLLDSGIEIEIIPEKEENYVFTLWHSTGPKKHVAWVKKIYEKKGISLNFEIKEEKEIYRLIGIENIDPRDRSKFLGEE